MTVCKIEEREAGRNYPRTCPTCKLAGPCAKGLDRKAMISRIEPLAEERDALAEKLAKAQEENKTLHSRIDGLMRDDTTMRKKLASAAGALREITQESMGEDGCYYINTLNIMRASATLAAIQEDGEDGN